MARPGYRIGFGVAAGYKNVGAGKGKIDDSGALYVLEPDGRIELRASVVDMGQAIRTTMVQLASEATGIGFGQFDLITQDTALTHPHRSASGQRQTLISGNAVVIAGRSFKQQLLGLVAGWHGMEPDELMIAGDEVRTQWSQYRREEVLMTLAQVAERAAAEQVEVRADAVYEAPRTWPLSDQEARRTVPREEYRNYPTYAYATQVAIVGVDEATGQVDLLRVIAAHDVGVAINPQQIRGQLIGSVSMGQGYAPQRELPVGERPAAVEAHRLRPPRGPDERQRHDGARRDRRGPVPRGPVRGQGDLRDRHRPGDARHPQRRPRRHRRARVRHPRRPAAPARGDGSQPSSHRFESPSVVAS